VLDVSGRSTANTVTRCRSLRAPLLVFANPSCHGDGSTSEGAFGWAKRTAGIRRERATRTRARLPWRRARQVASAGRSTDPHTFRFSATPVPARALLRSHARAIGDQVFVRLFGETLTMVSSDEIWGAFERKELDLLSARSASCFAVIRRTTTSPAGSARRQRGK
jgi:hypothetical protein